MGKRIAGAKVIVSDEISLTSLEDFYKQHLAYSRALSILTECQIEKKTDITNSIWWTSCYCSSVTSQHVLYYCTYYSVSLTCTVHCTYGIYCTLYMFPCFPVSHVCHMLKLHLQHLFTHVHTLLAITSAHSLSLT